MSREQKCKISSGVFGNLSLTAIFSKQFMTKKINRKQVGCLFREDNKC